ncbi:MAG: hypothetical protein AB1449_12515 [Chloroflexota bacterium]
MASLSLRRRSLEELEAARAARARGQEGRARVCARRAAGWAVADYLQRLSGQPPHASAYDLLRRLQARDEAPEGLRRAAARLTARVTADFRLPHAQDPLEDARVIVEGLLSPRT